MSKRFYKLLIIFLLYLLATISIVFTITSSIYYKYRLTPDNNLDITINHTRSTLLHDDYWTSVDNEEEPILEHMDEYKDISSNPFYNKKYTDYILEEYSDPLFNIDYYNIQGVNDCYSNHIDELKNYELEYIFTDKGVNELSIQDKLIVSENNIRIDNSSLISNCVVIAPTITIGTNDNKQELSIINSVLVSEEGIFFEDSYSKVNVNNSWLFDLSNNSWGNKGIDNINYKFKDVILSSYPSTSIRNVKYSNFKNSFFNII